MTTTVPEIPRYLVADSFASVSHIRHAFFTRDGGISEGIYASLNTGLGSDDEPRAVAENRRRIAATFDLPADALNTVYQVHGKKVVRVDGPWPASGPPQADAMVADRHGIALGILTADCAPVLFADEDAGVIGAAHAGWKGALSGVLQATIEAMEALGASRKSIAACVGPTIGPLSYEVGPEFPLPFLEADPENECFFAPASRAGHFMFDLPGFAVSVLRAAGIGFVENMVRDTCAEPESFFSYRRATKRGEPDYGRCLSAIALSKIEHLDR